MDGQQAQGIRYVSIDREAYGMRGELQELVRMRDGRPLPVARIRDFEAITAFLAERGETEQSRFGEAVAELVVISCPEHGGPYGMVGVVGYGHFLQEAIDAANATFAAHGDEGRAV